VIAALLAVSAVLYIGSRPRLPAPFGPAANGLVAYQQGWDLYVNDPTTGESRLLINRAAQFGFGWAGFSPDGTKFAYMRGATLATPEARRIAQSLVIVNADGSGDVKQLNVDPLLDAGTLAWSPDGRFIAVDHVVNDVPRISLVATDGSGVKTLDLGMPADFPSWRPPDGQKLVFRGQQADGMMQLFTVRSDGTELHSLGRPSLGLFGAGWDLGGPAWSPDGSRIAYNSVEADAGGTQHFRVHVVDAVGTGDVPLPGDAPDVHEAWPVWSPDGRDLIVQRWHWKPGSGYLALIPADGHDAGHDIGPKLATGEDAAWHVSWAPDGTRILAFTESTFSVVSIDPATGTYTTPSWTTTGSPAWQRKAP
jgi:Tol biopolymer transport system component